MFIKYRYKNKYKDTTTGSGEKITLPSIQQKGRYQLNYSPTNELLLKTTVDMVCHTFRQGKASKGLLVGESIGYKFKKWPVQLDGSIAWFYTDDYASRISMYEKSLLYTFHVPSFYGKGERYTLNVRYEWKKHLVFQAKYACTHYRDREIIGSGLEQIDLNNKNDLYFQIRLKF